MLFVAAVLASVALDATSLTFSIPGRLLVALAALGCFVFAVAYFRQQLVADDAGLHVRNLFSGFTLAWQDIDHFESPPAHFSREGGGPRFGLRVVTHDGRTLHISLWGANRLDLPTFADQLVAELEAMRYQQSDVR